MFCYHLKYTGTVLLITEHQNLYISDDVLDWSRVSCILACNTVGLFSANQNSTTTISDFALFFINNEFNP